MKKGSSTKRTSTIRKSSPKSRQDVTTTPPSPAQPAETVINNATKHTPVQVEPSNSSPRLTSPLATSRSPPPVQIPHTPVSSASPSPPSLLASGEQRMSQDQRTSAIVSWLQYTRNYKQNELLVRPFNPPPLAKVRPVAMYQRQYARDRELVAGLPGSTFGEAEEVGEGVESGEQGDGGRDDEG
ncbi:hypothetical protein E8E11_006572 [Didymella keratinophila]|nr:hypothetical protein E8E11_006572 [Didymella keratinophila]